MAAKKPGATGSLADLIDDLILKESTDVTLVGPIEFLNADWGLQMGLNGVPPMFPVQRFIVKALYGEALDDSEDRDIVIKDKFNEKVLHVFNEVEFYEYLRSKDCINKELVTIKDAQGNLRKAVDITSAFVTNLQLVVGRRGSKTSIVSFVLCYELYTLLSRYSPQEYFQIMLDDLIEITSISTNESNAKNLFDRVVGNLKRSKFFKPYMYEPKQFEVFFQTQRDIDLYGDWKRESLKLRAAPCSGKGLRGPNNICVVFDEAAFFFKDEGGGKATSDKSDRAIYDAATPAIAGFKHPDGVPAGREIMISSPADKSGLFYDKYADSFETESNYLMLKMPTWEMNPSISTPYLKGKYRTNPKVFKCEFGGEFSDQLFGWIDDANMVRSLMQPITKTSASSSRQCFLGVDAGFKEDGTSFAIVHWELLPDAEGNLVPTLVPDEVVVKYPWDHGVDCFEPDQICEWIVEYCKKYRILSGISDTYYHFAFEPYLAKRGIKSLEFRTPSPANKSQIWSNLLTKIISKSIIFPAGPLRVDVQNTVHSDEEVANETLYQDSELVKEILLLQATYKDKYQVDVFAPKGKHDDLSDAFARAVMAATEAMSSNKVHLGYNSIGGIRGNGLTDDQKLAKLIRKQEQTRAQFGRSTTPVRRRFR